MLQLKPIKGFNNIGLIYKNGIKFYANNATAIVVFRKNYSCQNVTKENSTIYFAVIIGKKTAKKAVVRNRIKRLLRESLRILTKQYNEKINCIEQIVLYYNAAPTHQKLIKLKDIMPAIENILMQAFIYYNDNNTQNFNSADKSI